MHKELAVRDAKRDEKRNGVSNWSHVKKGRGDMLDMKMKKNVNYLIQYTFGVRIFYCKCDLDHYDPAI